MTIYSLTPFGWELDLLEIKLAEQAPVVDVFVIAESPVSHRGLAKPLYLSESLAAEPERWWRWRDKLRVVVVDDAPDRPPIQPFAKQNGSVEEWARENHQRRALGRGLYDAEPDDVIVLSDLDEILRCQAIEWYAESKIKALIRPRLPMGVLWLNTCWAFPLTAIASLGRARMLRRSDPERMRHTIGFTPPNPGAAMVMKNVRLAGRTGRLADSDAELMYWGWHFSWIGGVEAVRHKVRNFAHRELEAEERTTDEWIEGCLRGRNELFGRKGREIHRFDAELLPAAVRDDLERWVHLLAPEPLDSPHDAEKILRLEQERAVLVAAHPSSRR